MLERVFEVLEGDWAVTVEEISARSDERRHQGDREVAKVHRRGNDLQPALAVVSDKFATIMLVLVLGVAEKRTARGAEELGGCSTHRDGLGEMRVDSRGVRIRGGGLMELGSHVLVRAPIISQRLILQWKPFLK